ncbi:MAG TPA: polysaccharide biosynthesis tyrosine autokinase [Lentimicrobium sp.]|nr:polysaccharide biosynthesis tyrosine autokinase [Lentimicrobium sp.]
MKRSSEILQQKTDYKELFYKLYRHKKWFILSFVIFILTAFIFNKVTKNTYENQTMLLLQEEENNNFMTGENIMQGFGLFAPNQNIENEIGILQSFTLINDAIIQLNLEASVYQEDYVFGKQFDFEFLKSTKEIYKESPIQVIIDKSSLQPIDLPIYIKILDNKKFKIEANGKEVMLYNYLEDDVMTILDTMSLSGIYNFGQPVKGKNFNFTVHLKTKNIAEWKNESVFFKMNNLNLLTLEYQSYIEAVNTSKTSSLVLITMKGDNKYKITQFLNTLSNSYLERNLEKKNRIAINTVKFIDSQISEVSDSLSIAESKLQNFRTSNQVMDLSFQGQKSFEKMNELESQRAVLIVQQKYYEYIREYFERNSDMSDLIAPSSMGVQDPILNQLITDLITLNSERRNLLNRGNTKNLFLKNIEIQISNLKKTIQENISNNAETTNIAIQDINNRVARIHSEMSRLPSTERQLFGIERKFKLNDAIYTFLLQKRSEAQIARASNAPDYEVVDPARDITTSVIYPKRTLNYVIAGVGGLLIPFIIIMISEFLNMRISGKKELESITELPIIGHVFHNESKNKIVIAESSNSPISESFRSIRTNLQFYSKGKEKQIILLTSSYSGEGKSFIAQNLASVFALFGKKTLLIGFDMRRPKIYQDLNLSNQIGMSTVLINKASVQEIIQPTQIQNLDYISAGPIPPNPLELIASDRTEDVFQELKELYDFIVIDSPPVGVVSDAYLLTKYVDVTLYIVRQGFTHKEAFTNNIQHLLQKKIQNVSLVLNDVKARGMSYDYGYEYTYYSENGKSSLNFFKNNKKRKKPLPYSSN